jgi:hypothetical protein
MLCMCRKATSQLAACRDWHSRQDEFLARAEERASNWLAKARRDGEHLEVEVVAVRGDKRDGVRREVARLDVKEGSKAVRKGGGGVSITFGLAVGRMKRTDAGRRRGAAVLHTPRAQALRCTAGQSSQWSSS